MKLSHAQRFALIHAYAPLYSVPVRFAPGEDGFSLRTLRSLQRKGLLRPDEDGDFEEAVLTDAGREALELTSVAPATLEEAVRGAVRLLMDDDPEEYFAAADVPAVCVDEDEVLDRFLWTDTSRVLAAIRVPGVMAYPPFGEDPDVLLDAVARRVTEVGYPVEHERYGELVYFSPPESDEE